MKKSILIPYDRYLYYKRLQDTSKDKQIKEAEQHTSEQQNPELEAENEHVTDYSPTQTDKLRPEIVVSLLPKRNRSKALALLNFIDRHPVLDWNTKGELLLHNNPIPFSHITDLTHDAINNTRSYDPVGCNEFYANIGHVPVSLITNPRRRLMIGGKSLPPPGIPDKDPVPLNTWKGLWKNL